MTTTVTVECACCGSAGLHDGRSLCHSCYHWHHANGTLGKYPPLRTWLATLARIEDFAELRRGGLSVRAAAARVGVTKRSGERYERRLKARQVAAS
ncbi:hypothetical protein ACBJ59_12315 [Nonomuraea sp. MTCD27]|uniref:hypothetical protein n=1 Tax=Nonomuraea sp. MTCD27 TaxID=1676747 RepID=UPI0035C05D26